MQADTPSSTPTNAANVQALTAEDLQRVRPDQIRRKVVPELGGAIFHSPISAGSIIAIQTSDREGRGVPIDLAVKVLAESLVTESGEPFMTEEQLRRVPVETIGALANAITQTEATDQGNG